MAKRLDWEGANRKAKGVGGPRVSSSTRGLSAVYPSDKQREELRDLGCFRPPATATDARILLAAFRPLKASQKALDELKRIPNTAQKVRLCNKMLTLLDQNLQKATGRLRSDEKLGIKESRRLREMVERRHLSYRQELEAVLQQIQYVLRGSGSP